jgi:hypothetical protein
MAFNTGLPNPLSKYYTLEELDIVISELINNNNPGQSHNLLQGILRNMLSIVRDVRDAAPVDPGGSIQLFKYTAGLGNVFGFPCKVTATTEDVTYSVTGGVGTITVPDGTTLLGFSILGETSLTSGGNFTVRIVFEDTDLVTDPENAHLCVWQVVNASAQDTGIPSAGLPNIVDNDNTPQKQFIKIADNTLELSVPSINAFTTWYINASMC